MRLSPSCIFQPEHRNSTMLFPLLPMNREELPSPYSPQRILGTNKFLELDPVLSSHSERMAIESPRSPLRSNRAKNFELRISLAPATNDEESLQPLEEEKLSTPTNKSHRLNASPFSKRTAFKPSKKKASIPLFPNSHRNLKEIKLSVKNGSSQPTSSEEMFVSLHKRSRTDDYFKSVPKSGSPRKTQGAFDFAHERASKSFSESFDEEESSRLERDFELISVLGSGEFGKVYHCLNRFDGIHYAIKAIERTDNESYGARNEAQALAGINAKYESKNFVKYYFSWEEGNTVYICMELCRENLASMKTSMQEPLTEALLLRIIKHICKALKKIHKDNIVHFDIKPSNILVSMNQKFKLGDMGLARNLQLQDDRFHIEEGDCRYMSKELLEDYNSKCTDYTKCDIFSLGISIYELMMPETIELPRNGPFWNQLRENNLSSIDELPYSPHLKHLVKTMMAADPLDRPSAKDILTCYLPKMNSK